MSVFVLSVHASYGCRERGACCTAGWPIPVELPILRNAEAAIGRGVLRTEGAPFTRPIDAPPDTPALLGVHDNECVFHRRRGSARCDLQRALGHAALPLACRQFPRVSLQDPRGTAVSLSHYCPTAAELLDVPNSVDIVEDASAFPSDGEYVGLDVRAALPPLLRPDLLMDWASWWLFEREAIALIDVSTTAGEALARLGHLVRLVEDWRPADGPLETRIARAAATARTDTPPRRADFDDAMSVVQQAIEPELRPPAPTRGPANISAGARRRFLAAHAFANWTIHLGRGGLRTWLRSLDAADTLLASGLDLREADLWLRHLIEPAALAERLDQQP
jgi:hypothetical protein